MGPIEPTPVGCASTSTSRSLLARLHGNESGAWDRLVELYAPLAWYWCQQLGVPGQEVADILQEVFQAVAAHIGTFRKGRPGDTFRGWLRTILRNKVRDYYRRLRREPRAEGGTDAQVRLHQVPEQDWDGEASGNDPACRQLFHRALTLIQAEFEARTWQAFWRVVVEGRAPQEVAADLGMSPGAVRIAKCRVLQRLRLELGDLTV